MLRGIIFSIIAGLAISLQSIFNARMGEKIGFWQTNTFVHGTGFLIALVILTFMGNFNFSKIKEVNPLYLLGGLIGVIIVFSVMRGIINLGASYAVTIILVTQILTNFLISKFGIFEECVIRFSPLQYLGLIIMTCGIIVFQMAK